MSQENLKQENSKSFLLDDVFLIGIMAVLAGCGLIYEYLLSHYASRVLGAIESTIFAMIGVMIVAMGFGSFAARKITKIFTAFAWLEFLIALLGVSSVLIIASMFAVTYQLPQLFIESYGLPSDLSPQGGIFQGFFAFTKFTPYLMGFVLGFLIGMEIPLIARIRQQIHQNNLTHNTGTIYGADYIGAGVGAAIWVGLMLSMDNSHAAAITASANLLVGFAFYWRYQKYIRFASYFFIAQLGLVALVMLIFLRGSDWETALENHLYRDNVIFTQHSEYQHITVTERVMSPSKPKIYSLYINGRLQFSSIDEYIYHEMLVHPAMMASANHDDVLIIGGGDGLALREVLRWQPKNIVMLELDKNMIEFFSKEKFDEKSGSIINKSLLSLNEGALSDERLKILFGDAFIKVDELLNQMQLYNVIIVDLPDPSHPDLNKLYTKRFYEKLFHLLKGDGSLVVQSTSPYHAKKAFISIGKTIKAAGFDNVEQYHENIPSFGEWGWSIATKMGDSASQRIAQKNESPENLRWVNKPMVLRAFVFPNNYFSQVKNIEINTLNRYQLYQYHQEAWKMEEGLINFDQ